MSELRPSDHRTQSENDGQSAQERQATHHQTTEARSEVKDGDRRAALDMRDERVAQDQVDRRRAVADLDRRRAQSLEAEDAHVESRKPTPPDPTARRLDTPDLQAAARDEQRRRQQSSGFKEQVQELRNERSDLDTATETQSASEHDEIAENLASNRPPNGVDRPSDATHAPDEPGSGATRRATTVDRDQPAAVPARSHSEQAETIAPPDVEPAAVHAPTLARDASNHDTADRVDGSERQDGSRSGMADEVQSDGSSPKRDSSDSSFSSDSTGDQPGPAAVPQDAAPDRLELTRYEGKPMVDNFRYETQPHHPENPFPGRAVERLSVEEREDHRIYFDGSGLLRNRKDGDLFDTRGAQTHWSGEGDRAIFIMDPQGNLYASKYQAVGHFHHSTLGNGEPVAAAGEMRVIDGQVLDVTAASGHYRPAPRHMAQLAAEFARNNVREVPINDFDGKTRLF